jgi:hypothetical protein
MLALLTRQTARLGGFRGLRDEMANHPNRNHDCIGSLIQAGIEYEDAKALRRISMTLHRWHELECGTDNGCIERAGENGDGAPFWVYYGGQGKPRRYPVADRENGALKRLTAIMTRYPTLGHYVQGDPRGASLYILRPGDVPDGERADSYYSRGIAVYK